MESAKIGNQQLFALIILFNMSSALLLPVGLDAKQDAWMAILFGLAGGLAIFLMYYRLYVFFPDELPTSYVQKLLGSFAGKIAAFLYMAHFLYVAARVLRDFGEMLTLIGYRSTPISVNQTLLLLLAIYAVKKGIEVISRSAEIFFFLIYLLAILGFVLILFSDLIELERLKPVMENGLLPVLKVAATQIILFPFGEIFIFSMIFPYLSDKKQVRNFGLAAVFLSGVNLAISMAINIAVLGVNGTARAQFPLLDTVQAIDIAAFLQRLDIFFMVAMIILGFFKATLYLYAATIGLADIFKIRNTSKLVFPLGLIVLITSVAMSANLEEHIYEGTHIVTVYLEAPIQIFFPLFLLIIAFIKYRKKAPADG